MSKKFKRTRLWVDAPFQLSLLGRVGLYFVTFSLMVFHLAFALDSFLYIAEHGVDQNFLDFYFKYIYQQRALVVTFILVTPIFLYDTVKFSHRVAGPLFRCRRLMEDMAAGKPVSEFHPRRRDLMRNFFDTFNRVVKEWNKRRGPVTTTAGDGHPFETAQLHEERNLVETAAQKV